MELDAVEVGVECGVVVAVAAVVTAPGGTRGVLGVPFGDGLWLLAGSTSSSATDDSGRDSTEEVKLSKGDEGSRGVGGNGAGGSGFRAGRMIEYQPGLSCQPNGITRCVRA